MSSSSAINQSINQASSLLLGSPMSSTPLMKKNVCQNCKVACKSGKSNNFLCPRCRFMDSLPIIKSSSKEEEEACSICLVDFNSKGTTTRAVINELPCGHQFHRECIYEWIGGRSKYSCPLCRYKLPIDDDTITARDDGLIPARYELINGRRIYLNPPDRTMLMFFDLDGCYYFPRSWLIPRPRPQPQVVVTTNNTNGRGRTTTTTSVHNNTTIILQDEDGDSVMLDNNTIILQDEDGDTLMIDA